MLGHAASLRKGGSPHLDLSQEQSPVHQRGSALPSVGHEHPRLAVGHFAQPAAVRPGHAHRVRTLLGHVGRVHQEDAFTLTQRGSHSSQVASGNDGPDQGMSTAKDCRRCTWITPPSGPRRTMRSTDLRRSPDSSPSESDRNETHWSRRGNRQKTFQAGLQVGMQVRWAITSQRRGRGRDGGLGGTTGAEAHPGNLHYDFSMR